MDEEHKITITFNADGSALYTMEVSGNIYSQQFLMLAQEFEYQGKRMKEDARMAYLIAEQERQQRNSIIPAGGILKP